MTSDDETTRGTLARRPPLEQLILTLRRQDELRADGTIYPNPRLTCEDCAGPDFGYMLRDDIWREIRAVRPDDRPRARGPGPGRLCLRCATVRLGRPLEVADLTNAIVNLPILFGIELGARTAGGLP